MDFRPWKGVITPFITIVGAHLVPGGMYMGVSKNDGTPKWMVKIMENPIKMNDLGIPLFLETPILNLNDPSTLRHWMNPIFSRSAVRPYVVHPGTVDIFHRFLRHLGRKISHHFFVVKTPGKETTNNQ